MDILVFLPSKLTLFSHKVHFIFCIFPNKREKKSLNFTVLVTVTKCWIVHMHLYNLCIFSLHPTRQIFKKVKSQTLLISCRKHYELFFTSRTRWGQQWLLACFWNSDAHSVVLKGLSLCTHVCMCQACTHSLINILPCTHFMDTATS